MLTNGARQVASPTGAVMALHTRYGGDRVRSAGPRPGRATRRNAVPLGAPSKSSRSIRTWSWNHSRWTAQAAAERAVWRAGAQWADSGTWKASALPRREQPGDAEAAGRVCLENVDSVRRSSGAKSGTPEYSPAAIANQRRTVAQRPQASEIVGCHGLLEPLDPARRDSPTPARRRSYAPLASTNNATSGPIASRATSSRSGSAAGSRPIFILTIRTRRPPNRPAGAEPLVVVRREAAAPIRHDHVVHRPSRSTAARQEAAFRSHSAMSTAEIASRRSRAGPCCEPPRPSSAGGADAHRTHEDHGARVASSRPADASAYV